MSENKRIIHDLPATKEINFAVVAVFTRSDRSESAGILYLGGEELIPILERLSEKGKIEAVTFTCPANLQRIFTLSKEIFMGLRYAFDITDIVWNDLGDWLSSSNFIRIDICVTA